jgi:hypothetical protein
MSERPSAARSTRPDPSLTAAATATIQQVQAPSAPETERGLELRTLLIASVASATAAIVTSFFWRGGTIVSAAVTPVIVALVKEILHRHARRMPEVGLARRAAVPRGGVDAERWRAGRLPPGARTSRPPAAGPGDGVPPRADAGAPRRSGESHPPRTRPEEQSTASFRRIYGRRPLRVRAMLATALVAFLVGAAALTLPELLTGHSIGGGGGRTTLFSGGGERHERKSESSPDRDRGGSQPRSTEARPQERRSAPSQSGRSAPGRRSAPKSGSQPSQPQPAPQSPPTVPAPQPGSK